MGVSGLEGGGPLLEVFARATRKDTTFFFGGGGGGGGGSAMCIYIYIYDVFIYTHINTKYIHIYATPLEILRFLARTEVFGQTGGDKCLASLK